MDFCVVVFELMSSLGPDSLLNCCFLKKTSRYDFCNSSYIFNLNTHGRNKNMGIILNISPPMVPMAREYQKGCSSGLSIRNGIMPNTVERMARKIGMIL